MCPLGICNIRLIRTTSGSRKYRSLLRIKGWDTYIYTHPRDWSFLSNHTCLETFVSKLQTTVCVCLYMYIIFVNYGRDQPNYCMTTALSGYDKIVIHAVPMKWCRHTDYVHYQLLLSQKRIP